ncbi:MAG: hypothetical protein WBW14_24095 [Candidatus Acidiferrum sp.]
MKVDAMMTAQTRVTNPLRRELATIPHYATRRAKKQRASKAGSLRS